MEFIGATSVSTPNQSNVYQYPPIGYINLKLDSTFAAPSGSMLVIGVPYIISSLGGSNNEIVMIDGTGTRTPLNIIFTDALPGILLQGNAYVINTEGYRSSFYVNALYLNFTVEYRITVSSSFITPDMMDALFPVFDIKYLPYRETENFWLKPADGTTGLLNARHYPVYTAKVIQLGLLDYVGGNGSTTIGIPDLTGVVAFGAKDVTQLRGLLPLPNDYKLGQRFEKSTIPNVGFNHPHNHNLDPTGIKDYTDVDKGSEDFRVPEFFNSGLTYDTSTNQAPPDFNQPVFAGDPNKFQFSNNVALPPIVGLIPHILVR